MSSTLISNTGFLSSVCYVCYSMMPSTAKIVPCWWYTYETQVYVIGRMIWNWWNDTQKHQIGGKPVPAPFYSPQIPNELAWH
jgi:hypothetical protein